LMPRTCAVCGNTLGREQFLCDRCLDELPLTRLELADFNDMEQQLAGPLPIERACALFLYERGNAYSAVLHDIKYRNIPQMGRWLAAYAARRFAPTGVFAGVQAVVPVPLHASKRAQRGYNQSEHIAQGVADVLRVPVLKRALAAKPHPSQTQRTAIERQRNAEGMFTLRTAGLQKVFDGITTIDEVIRETVLD
ncbi:MAG: hypothetical protein IKT12_03550, partial [Thermoguttaceae bacterium]|nr:hypothetical protein [Thermoguttaceae bacterium]